MNVEVDGAISEAHVTPLKMQVELIEAAIQAAIEFTLAQPCPDRE